jgi:hypothetical protein
LTQQIASLDGHGVSVFPNSQQALSYPQSKLFPRYGLSLCDVRIMVMTSRGLAVMMLRTQTR